MGILTRHGLIAARTEAMYSLSEAFSEGLQEKLLKDQAGYCNATCCRFGYHLVFSGHIGFHSNIFWVTSIALNNDEEKIHGEAEVLY